MSTSPIPKNWWWHDIVSTSFNIHSAWMLNRPGDLPHRRTEIKGLCLLFLCISFNTYVGIVTGANCISEKSMQMENQVHCYKYQAAFYMIGQKMLVCPSPSDSHLFCMFHTGKTLPSSPTLFHMNSQESDDIQKFAAGFGGKRPPWISTYNAPCTCSSVLGTVTLPREHSI